jgi:UDP-N-acetyl-alpha-D-muramoyl-L-alanyl-L-glutamate epimerase
VGMMEIPSYWKATCSPIITIAAGALNADQAAWWRKLLLAGLGEFFYRNEIEFWDADFVSIRGADRDPMPRRRHEAVLDSRHVLVPVGGGKDSALALALLRRHPGSRVTAWSLNPTPAVLGTIAASGTSDFISAYRVIDPTLLELHHRGFLNGHEPFSAYLAFLSLTSAVVTGHGRVALSNEQSANEGTASWNGMSVNHQYSKSFEFERMFREYTSKYLAISCDYFSILRPLYEIQIAEAFAKHPEYLFAIKSCNIEQRYDRWCRRCPKCLFVFTILYPFIDADVLSDMFGGDLFQDTGLLPLALQLTGREATKPFECVGTVEEVIVAFALSRERASQRGRNLPPLLEAVQRAVLCSEPNLDRRAAQILRAWDEEHTIPDSLAAYLRKTLQL